MSRNLAMTCCDRCRAPSVRLDEAPRLITVAEAGPYYNEYRSLKVANATCPRCQAQYLAWVSGLPHYYCWVDPDDGYFDLSYRSTFNDEPGLDDLPKPNILVELDEQIGRQGISTTDTLVRAWNALAECLGWKP